MNNPYIIPNFDDDKINEIVEFYNLNNGDEITNGLAYNFGYTDGCNDCNEYSENSFSSSDDYSSLGLGSNSANSSLHSSVSSLTDLDTTDYPDDLSLIDGGKKRKKLKSRGKSKKHKKRKKRKTKRGGMDFLRLDIEKINQENEIYNKSMPSWLKKFENLEGVRILHGDEKKKVIKESKVYSFLMKNIYYQIYNDLINADENEFIENMFIVIETNYNRNDLYNLMTKAKERQEIEEIINKPVYYSIYSRDAPKGQFRNEPIKIETKAMSKLKQLENPYSSMKNKKKSQKTRSITPDSIIAAPTLGGKRKKKRKTLKRKK